MPSKIDGNPFRYGEALTDEKCARSCVPGKWRNLRTMKFRTRSLLSVLSAIALLGSPVYGAPSKAKPEPKPANQAVKSFNEGTDLLMELEFEAATAALEAALKANPEMAEAHNNLAYTLRKQGKDFFDSALKHYNTAIQLDPELAEAYMYRGVLYVQMGEKEKALADHAVLLDLDPELAEELEYVVANGEEKEPEQFFGVVPKI